VALFPTQGELYGGQLYDSRFLALALVYVLLNELASFTRRNEAIV